MYNSAMKRWIVVAMQLGVLILAAVGGSTLLKSWFPPAKETPVASAPRRPVSGPVEERYLEMMKLYLTRYDYGRTGHAEEGTDWPEFAETMIGLKRLDNLHQCVRDVLERKVPGDLIETGVWRGGATIFMRAALEAYGDRTRTVWVADSFQGLPKPRPEIYPADKGSAFWTFKELSVGVNQVKANFARYGLLDDRVRFLPGWFKDTLPAAPISQLALLRVDADMYEGTLQSLDYLYPKVSPGGYVIIDDYYGIQECGKAVDDYRRRAGISAEIKKIDWTGGYWRKP